MVRRTAALPAVAVLDIPADALFRNALGEANLRWHAREGQDAPWQCSRTGAFALAIYPLDGSHVLESLLVRKFPRFFMFMRRYGQWILIALLFLGVISTVLGTAVNGIFSGFYWLASRLIPIAPIV